MSRTCPASHLEDLELLFGHMPMGIVVLDRDLRIRRLNPAWAAFAERYGRFSIDQIVPGLSFFDVIPGTEASLKPIFARVLAGETARQEAVRLEIDGAASCWDVVLVPFSTNGEVAGILQICVDVTERKRMEEMLRVSYQALERRVEERTSEIERRNRVAEGSRDILATLNSEQSREKILKHIVSRADRLLDSDACLIYRLEQENQWMVVESECGLPPDYKALGAGPIYATAVAQASLSREPAAISDLPAYVLGEMAGDGRLTDFHRRWFETAARHFCSTMSVPLVVKDALYGGMVFYYREQHELSEEEFRLGMMLGDQAALAIENSRLRAQAELVAVVKERERLARELHDSVTQSLYSVTLLSEAGRQLAEVGDLARIGGYLARLGEISQQALREMRLLVYELRPLVLRREGLVGALQQRLDAVEKRAGVDARLLVEGEVDLPSSVEEALYRIAQEALNNALKHAGASNVTVCVSGRDDRVELEVVDDGAGFDPSAAGKDGGLGLTSMRERAEKAGGVLDIISAPGQGTKVRACVKLDRESQAGLQA
ncbi:MAG: PAS domain-containing protein [Anaerolineae bacterium]|nr:PAS domain-containing protein [Anaerolineae bacterium]